MNKVLLLIVTLIFVVGCAVKKQGSPEDNNHSVSSTAFPNGIAESDHGSFLVYLPTPKLVPYKWNTLVYHLSDLELNPLDSSDYEFSVGYNMPDMPSMRIDNATWKLTAPGVLEVTYHISMAGDWNFWLTVTRHGALVDSFTRTFNVPFTQ